jgi:transcriptional regulator
LQDYSKDGRQFSDLNLGVLPAVYEVRHFVEDRLEVQHELIKAHPLGLLICNDADGRLVANQIPFMLFPELGEFGTLRAHIARGNPQWTELQTVHECLVVFQGEDAYVSPNWYPSKQQHGKVVPTWNYVTVHVWGKPVAIDDPVWVKAQVDQLTEKHEATQPKPWAVDDAPADFTSSMIKGIVGIEIAISDIKGKWKVSQNRPRGDILGVSSGLFATDKNAMADYVAQYIDKE